MSNISIFAFEGYQVRFVGTAEQPEWVAASVCSILGLNTSLVINGRSDRPNSGLDSDEKGIAIVNTSGGEQEMLTVTEPGLGVITSSLSTSPMSKRSTFRIQHFWKLGQLGVNRSLIKFNQA